MLSKKTRNWVTFQMRIDWYRGRGRRNPKLPNAYRLSLSRVPGSPRLWLLGGTPASGAEVEQALPIVQALQLRQHSLSSSQKVFVFTSLAEISLESGDSKRASQFLQRV